MSAARLRSAAALMRERAASASLGPWEPHVLGSEGYDVRGAAIEREGSRIPRRPRVARCGNEAWPVGPAVALAVADWLDEEARWVDSGNEVIPAALAVANAYLGDSA